MSAGAFCPLRGRESQNECSNFVSLAQTLSAKASFMFAYLYGFLVSYPFALVSNFAYYRFDTSKNSVYIEIFQLLSVVGLIQIKKLATI